MIKDIEIPQIKNVTVAITRDAEEDEWRVMLINSNDYDLDNTLVASKGYGERDGEQQKTSTLRHFLQTVQAHSTVPIETIKPDVFHLNNEYWVSFYAQGKIYDKRFVFVPDSICDENLTFIKELNAEGILHS